MQAIGARTSTLMLFLSAGMLGACGDGDDNLDRSACVPDESGLVATDRCS